MIRKSHLQKKFQKAFTLVELLIAISIIGIMGSMVLFALLGAQNDAKVARTRGTIQKINEIVLQKWEEYRYKSINVQLDPTLTVPVAGVYPVAPREAARVKMVVQRDVMRMEMPDRISDLIYPPTHYTIEYTAPSGTVTSTKLPRAIPPGYGLLYNTLRNQLISLKSRGVASWSSFDLMPLPAGPLGATAPINKLTSNSLADWDAAVQSSELLYLLVSTCNYSGSSALEYFKSTEIGDIDSDGLLEFIDAWGNPIAWIRWPAGYPGDLVRYADADAMDPVRTDWRSRSSGAAIATDWQPRTLVPLVISSGPDGEFGVTFDFDGAGVDPIVYATMTWPTTPAGIRGVGTNPVTGSPHTHYTPGLYYYPDPFFTWDDSNKIPNGPASTIPAPDNDAVGYRHNQLGSIPNAAAQFATDNITSHDIILEP